MWVFSLLRRKKPAAMPQACASAGLVAGSFLEITASGIELLGREGDPAEHLAGIFRAAGVVAAFLYGDAVIQHGNHQLGIPFQPYDGELSQCNKHAFPVSGEHQIFIEEPPDPCRDLVCGFPAAAFTVLLYAGIEDHGIQNLYHSGRQIGLQPGQSIRAADNGIASEDMCPAVLAAQNSPLGEDCKTVQRCRPSGTDNGISKDPVVECNVNAVVIPVKSHRLHECLVRLEKSRCRIEITVDVSKLVLEPGFEMSNRNIKAYIEDKYGFKVHDQYIAQIRGKLGLKYHEGYNKTEVHTRKITICPEYKEAAIMDALEYFGCI